MIEKDTIKPKVKGKSDFFSWQLFRWIRKNPEYCRIWKMEDGRLMIGDKWENEISGSTLTTLCRYDQKLTVYSFCMSDISKWEEVTESFWKDYMRIGVCAIHGDNAHDWEVGGTLRACRNCHKTETQKSEMVERKYWEAV